MKSLPSKSMRIALLALPLTALLALTACQSSGRNTAYPQKKVERHDQAGSSHVAVLSVIPWDEYKA